MARHIWSATVVASVSMAGLAQAEEVEVYLTDMLDNVQNGYCLDIARAQGAAANPDDGLQGHTCYSPGGSLEVDQVFDSAKFADGVLYMPKFDVCAQLSATDAGTEVDLATCDGSAEQSFVFSGEGTITPTSAPEMCVTIGEETRSGRSDANQIKTLALQACDADQAAYQTWSVRTAAD